MSLSSWLWGASQVDEVIDKATSELLPTGSEDIALNLEISDQIRSKAVPQKDAIRALKRRLNHKNPNVQLLALSLTDTCVKNGGDHFLMEVASRDFMDNLVSILKMPALNHEVKAAILRYIQNWSYAFEGKLSLSYVDAVYKTLKSEGFTFPPRDVTVGSSAMVDTQTAPEWIDSDVCLRCRTAFTFTNRKHHCRNCGQVFDQQCSSKSLPLPHFGITQEVRVCDACHFKLMKKHAGRDGGDGRHQRSFSTRHRSARDFADEELQRAIQLSLEEVGSASASGRYSRPQPEPSVYNNWEASEPPLVDRKTRPSATTSAAEEEEDPDLRAAIEASLREASAPKPSAPISMETPRPEQQSYAFPQAQPHSYHAASSVAPPTQPNYDLQPLESDVIMTFSQTVHDVEERGGRDLTRYPAVNDLYDKASGLRPKLALSLDDADRKEQTLTDMHNKLSQAVKLYDSLLSQQLNRSSWRAAPQQDAQYGVDSQPQPYQQVQPQWTGQQQHIYGHYNAQTPIPQSQTPKPYSPARQSSQNAIPQQYQPVYAQAQSQPVASPPPQAVPYATQQQSAQAQYAYAPQHAQQSVPAAPIHSPPPQQSQVQTPVSYAPPTGYVPQVSSPPPVQQQSLQQGPPQAAYSQTPTPTVLSRQNTLSYAPPPPQQQRQPAQPVPPPQQQYQAYQPPPQQHPQQQYNTQPPTQLPSFPAVPTAALPQTPAQVPVPVGGGMNGYANYAAAFEQPDRKEAMLIDL